MQEEGMGQDFVQYANVVREKAASEMSGVGEGCSWTKAEAKAAVKAAFSV
jgi:hypothetical protein